MIFFSYLGKGSKRFVKSCTKSGKSFNSAKISFHSCAKLC